MIAVGKPKAGADDGPPPLRSPEDPEEEAAETPDEETAEDGEKISPERAGYRSSMERCSECDHFMDGECEVVSGQIDPDGSCGALFKAKGGGASPDKPPMGGGDTPPDSGQGMMGGKESDQ